MNLDRVALAVTRILNIIQKHPGKSFDERANLFEKVIGNTLTSSSAKAAFADMIVSMTLLTSGNTDSVRDPSAFDEYMAEPISEILSEPSMLALEIVGFDMSQKPTRKHYATAKALLPVMASSSMGGDEVFSVFKKSKVQDSDITKSISQSSDEKEGYDYLYRGLHDLSVDSILSLMKTESLWDMTRGVSTSNDYRSALGFKDNGPGHRALLSITNPKREGFIAQNLSLYGGESEVIFSGKAEIESYTLSFYCEFYDMENTERTEPIGGAKFEIDSEGMIMARIDRLNRGIGDPSSLNRKLIYFVDNATEEEQMKLFGDLHKKGEFIITAGNSWNIAKPLQGHRLKLKPYGEYGDINTMLHVI